MKEYTENLTQSLYKLDNVIKSLKCGQCKYNKDKTKESNGRKALNQSCMNMIKTANELYEISKSRTPELVAEILDGVRDHIIQRCEEEAYKGATYYSCYLNQGLSFVKDLLLDESIRLAKEFEDKGYKVSIEDHGNGYYVDFVMRLSWDNKLVKFNSGNFGNNKLLYTTDDGLVAN